MARDSIDPRMGGVPGVTIDRRKAYNEYRIEVASRGDEPLPFEEWSRQIDRAGETMPGPALRQRGRVERLRER